MPLHPIAPDGEEALPGKGANGMLPRRGAFAGNAAAWLSFGACPAFALMAAATAFSGIADTPCSMGQGASLLGGMVPMYLLMSAVHLSPWLRLVAQAPGDDV